MKKILLILALLVSGCAQPIPPKINHTPDKQVQSSQLIKESSLKAKVDLTSKKPKVSQDLVWGSPTNEVFFQAQNENKCMLFYFYMNNCLFCEQIEQEAFSEKSVIDLINNGFIPVKINIEESSIASVFEIYASPTILFLATDGHLLLKTEGVVPETAMIEILKIVKPECNKPKETKQMQDLF